MWRARPALAHLRDFARARLASPWGVLGVTLARVVTAVPPCVQLPPIIGGRASVNLFVGVVGTSGEGKGAAEHAAADALDVGPIEDQPLGSGEGIAHAYMRVGGTAKDRHAEQHTEAVLFRVHEIDAVAAIDARRGSTLLPQLRSAWMGERLGFHYVDTTKRMPVPAHRYRLCLVAGIQPARARVLLDDSDGGTPQRFLWLPADDPDMAAGHPEPAQVPWRRPAPLYVDHHGRVVMSVCDTATQAITAARVARGRREADALDGHSLLCREKVAAALALLDSRLAITEDDWHLAGLVMAKSDATRAEVVDTIRRQGAAANRARGEAEATRAVLVAERVEGAAVQRVCRVLLRAATSAHAGITRVELRRAAASRDRHMVDDALARLVEAGQLRAEDTSRDPGGHGGTGTRFYVQEKHR